MSTIHEIDARNAYYGVNETNPLVDSHTYYYEQEWQGMTLAEFAAAGGRITRVRWLTEAIAPRVRIADLSYVHGVLPNGQAVRIDDAHASFVPFPKMTATLIEWAKEAGVYAKGIGLLDRSNWSVLR